MSRDYSIEIEHAATRLVNAIDAIGPGLSEKDLRRQRIREMAITLATAWLSKDTTPGDRTASMMGTTATLCATAAYDAIEAAVAKLE